MTKWITIIFSFFCLSVNAQYFHRIPVCFNEIEPQKYSIEINPNYEYQFVVNGGYVISEETGEVLIQWSSSIQFGELIVIVENDIGCQSQSNLTMQILPCDETFIWVPNTFSPNSDGDNDIFTPKGINIIDYEMTIYNRWGEELYFTRNILGGWDGYFKGKVVPLGDYSYKINYLDNRNNLQTIVGKINILR